MITCTSLQKVYGMHFIAHSILLSITRLISTSLAKLSAKPLRNGTLFLRKNSIKQSASAMTRQYLALTSTLAFNISQFFPSLNYRLLTLILEKVSLEFKVSSFFANYLVKKKTSYLWNNLSSPNFKVNMGVGQESALSPILLALYLSPFLYILEKHLKNLKIPISILLFVDDGLIITQNKSLDISNSHLFCSYNILSKLFDSFSLIIEHAKTENFHFNRLHGVFNPPLLDLSPIGGPILHSKDTWKYLSFIFDQKLMFYQHIDHYLNKAISMVKCMKLLGNLL